MISRLGWTWLVVWYGLDEDVHHNGQLLDGVELTVTNYGHPMTYEKAEQSIQHTIPLNCHHELEAAANNLQRRNNSIAHVDGARLDSWRSDMYSAVLCAVLIHHFSCPTGIG
eukprot:5259880-Amphidinium_carterae.1